jgi:predicted phosphoribosyltransferase
MFKDRNEAGQLLADKLLQYKKEKDTLFLAISIDKVTLKGNLVVPKQAQESMVR